VRRLACALALAALVLPASASADVRLKGVDATGYPVMRATVVTSSGSAKPAVREDGRAVVGLERQNLGRTKAVVVAVDRSRSMAGSALSDAVAAARSFVAVKSPGDEISVVAFGHGAYALSRPSALRVDSDTALQNLRLDAAQGTSLYDAVVLSARQLRLSHLSGRLLVVLTDGRDAGSRASLQQAVEAAHDAGVAVYAIGIEGQGFDPAALQRLARETGGQYYGASSTSSLRGVYASLASALNHTWRVQYVTAAAPGERIRLEASAVGAGIGTASYEIPTFGLGSATPEAPTKLVPEGAYGPTGPLAIAVGVAALVLLAAFLALAAFRGSWVRTRIAAHVGETRATSKAKRREQRLSALTAVFRVTERAFGHLRQWRAIQRLLDRADVPLRTVEFFWIMMGAACLLGVLVAATGQGPLFALLGLAVGGGAPFAFVWFKMRRRLRAFEEQLPDVLITIAASLKAGHSFKQGLQSVVDEGLPPAADEFRRVLTETSLGRPMDEALTAMSERTGSKNFEFAITAVTIQRQVGGSLASLFDMVADTVRQRQQFARKIKSLTAMGRMSAYVLAGIPFFLAFAITLLNREYMNPLFSTHAGHMLVLLGLGMMAIGSALLKKIVSFKG
jgi:tight adherence protein B